VRHNQPRLLVTSPVTNASRLVVAVPPLRFQSQLPGERRYTRVFPTLATIWREEGPTALYKGFVPKALRLGIGQSVGLLTFQEALKAFGAAHTPADDAREARAAALISE
jgi:solute carrier family 25 2-oxodicarboxylate transporter 21